jgi:hypothetical protein
MPCDHDENTGIADEKAGVATWVAKDEIHHGPCHIRAWVDGTDDHPETRAEEKLAVLRAALDLVHQQTEDHLHLDLLYLYLSPRVRCIAYAGEAEGERTTTIFLGDKMFQKSAKTTTAKQSGVVGGMSAGVRGVADQEYDAKRKSVLNPKRWVMSKEEYQASKANAKAVAVVVHELGHVLHERASEADFWAMKLNKDYPPEERPEGAKLFFAPAHLAEQVSQYALSGHIEYIPEVFTGLIYGKRYSDAVIAQYKREGGPPVIWDRRTHRDV